MIVGEVVVRKSSEAKKGVFEERRVLLSLLTESSG